LLETLKLRTSGAAHGVPKLLTKPELVFVDVRTACAAAGAANTALASMISSKRTRMFNKGCRGKFMSS
jgi:hypothetical protein